VADGILALDRGLRISNLNSAARRLLDTSWQEAVGRSCLDLLHPSTELTDLLRQRRPVDRCPQTLHTAGGETALFLSLPPW